MHSNTNPFFTVITPTYNRAHLLSALFGSLNNQTFTDFEWIIADDGSTDNTDEVIENFIKTANFQIVYLKLKHGGKHNTCLEAGKHVRGKYVVNIDSDDELYAENSLQDIYDEISKLPDNNFWGVGCCFINQDGKVFPALNTDFEDITQDKFLEYFTSKSYMLNYFGVFKSECAKMREHPKSENLAYYPEIVDILQTVLENKDYRIRLFNKTWYKYNMYNPDSVTVLHKDSVIFWIECVEIVNSLYKYGLDKKYKEFIHIRLNRLGRNIYKQKGFKATLDALQSEEAKKYFIYACCIRRFLRYIFLIDKQMSRIKVYLFGIKIFALKRK